MLSPFEHAELQGGWGQEVLMRRLLLVIVGLAFFSGCSKLSGDFQKSDRSAFLMIQQAEDGAPVLQTDLSRAFIEMKYAAKTDNDKRALQILTFYRDQYISHDDTPPANKPCPIAERQPNRFSCATPILTKRASRATIRSMPEAMQS
jgi:hypothetical protein